MEGHSRCVCLFGEHVLWGKGGVCFAVRSKYPDGIFALLMCVMLADEGTD